MEARDDVLFERVVGRITRILVVLGVAGTLAAFGLGGSTAAVIVEILIELIYARD